MKRAGKVVIQCWSKNYRVNKKWCRMTVSLGLVCNVYNECNALPGWLEMAHNFFDHVSCYHAGPRGQESTDGTIALLEKWKVPIHRGAIDEGFGIVRTAAIRSSPCQWVMLLDADERFYPLAPTLTCEGESTPPDEVNQILQEYDCRKPEACPSNFENVHKLGAKLRVHKRDVYDQGAWLRDILEHGDLDAVCTIRRHWHDFSWQRPTQNWHVHPDYQVRLMKNTPGVFFDANTRMHERLIGANNVHMPNQTHGPFFDHYHMFFKRMEPNQRRFDVACYDSIHWGHPMPNPEDYK